MEHIVDTTEATGAYSPAVVAEGRFVFVSGQGPLRGGVVVPGSVAEQTLLTLENLRSVLHAAGAHLDDVVRCGVFLADIADFAEMDAVYRDFFPGALPARTTIGAALDGISVEIDCIARLEER